MGRVVEGLKTAIKNVTGVEVAGRTKGEVLADYNRKAAVVKLGIDVVDANGAVTGASVTLKEGATVGAGTTVTAGEDSTYSVKYGDYNYSISKVGYATQTGVIEIGDDDVRAGAKTVTVTIVANT